MQTYMQLYAHICRLYVVSAPFELLLNFPEAFSKL